tara:strand:+ start:1222 stop:1971 length:750 start_codon:yes stop_codon:yes gene_type:complete
MSKLKYIISGGKFAGKKMSDFLKKKGTYIKGAGKIEKRPFQKKVTQSKKNYSRRLEERKAARRYVIKGELQSTIIPIKKQSQIGGTFQTHKLSSRIGKVAAESESKINFKPLPTIERMFKKDIQKGTLQDYADTKKYLKNTLSDVKKKNTGGVLKLKRGGDNMPPRNKKNFRPTKKGAGMTAAGVAAYRRANPGSKLKTAVTGKVKPGSKDAKRRKSFCARSLGQMKKFPKAAKDPNSRLRQARRRWKC